MTGNRKILVPVLVAITVAVLGTMPRMEDTTQAAPVEPIPEPTPAVVEVWYPVPLDKDLQSHIVDQCEGHGIDPAIVMAMIWKESNFNADAVGDNGNSFGLMQIQPRWHQPRMDKLGVDDLFDPYQNVTVGIDYLAELLDMHRGIAWALMAYNGGYGYANSMMEDGLVSDYTTRVLTIREDIMEGMTS